MVGGSLYSQVCLRYVAPGVGTKSFLVETTMRPINEPMGGGRILPELEADPFAPLGGKHHQKRCVQDALTNQIGAIVGPIQLQKIILLGF